MRSIYAGQGSSGVRIIAKYGRPATLYRSVTDYQY